MTIKTTAGKIILYLYKLQRSAPLEMPVRQLGFVDKKPGNLSLTSDKTWFARDLLSINASPSDVYNAYSYLLDKRFIRSKVKITPHVRVFVGAQLTDKGFDIVEGVERSDEGPRYFEQAFNIDVGQKSSVDELIKQTLSGLSD